MSTQNKLTSEENMNAMNNSDMENKKYRHKWTKQDFMALFSVCAEIDNDDIRVNELKNGLYKNRFKYNRENGLRMKIEQAKALSEGRFGYTRNYFKWSVSNSMARAWDEWK